MLLLLVMLARLLRVLLLQLRLWLWRAWGLLLPLPLLRPHGSWRCGRAGLECEAAWRRLAGRGGLLPLLQLLLDLLLLGLSLMQLALALLQLLLLLGLGLRGVAGLYVWSTSQCWIRLLALVH